MSGGTFDYNQRRITEIADHIEQYIYGRELDEDEVDYYLNDLFFWDDEEKEKVEKYVRKHHRTYPNINGFSDTTITHFRRALNALRKAAIYAQRIDWLLCGDDGEDTFHERLDEELEQWSRQRHTQYTRNKINL